MLWWPSKRLVHHLGYSNGRLWFSDSRRPNLQIHVERAINRIKKYRILKGTLPITMMQHVDEIILVCAGLCNIKNVLIQIKKD